jgi:hypothetical protein
MSTAEHKTYANGSTGEDLLLCREGFAESKQWPFLLLVYFFSEG